MTEESKDTPALMNRRALLTGGWRKPRPRPPPEPNPVRPPGAAAPAEFDRLCDGCGDCVAECPAAAIVLTGPATAQYGASPVIDAATSPCVMCDGLVCSTVCPTGALKPTTPDTMRIATIAFDPGACWARGGQDPGCDYCYDRCPLKGAAITHARGFGPTLNPDVCTGCGVCVYFCPSQPCALGVAGGL